MPPTEKHRKEFETAIKNKDSSKIRELLQRDDAKELLLMKDKFGRLVTHDACRYDLDKTLFQLILDAALEHGIIKQMLEQKDKDNLTCLQEACRSKLSADSFGLLLLEYLSKYADLQKSLGAANNQGWMICLRFACVNRLPSDSFCLLLQYLSTHNDIKKMLEETDSDGWSCLHYTCSFCASADFLCVLISFFASKELCTRALATKNRTRRTPVDHTNLDQVKQLLQDPDCWQKCRLWLLQNHEEAFLYSLFPNSFEKTCEALKELTENALQHSQQHSTIMLIALMTSPSKFRAAVEKTDSSAPMASYFNVVRKGDEKSTYNQWRKNINRFREFYGQWPPSEKKTATTYEHEGEDSSCSCVIQ